MGASAFPLLRHAPPISRPLPTLRPNAKPLPVCCVALALGPASPGNRIRRRRGGLPLFAGANGNGLNKEEASPLGEKQAGEGETSNSTAPSGGGGGGGQGAGKERPRHGAASAGIRWQELLLNPDPDNVLAVGLTGLLAWASVQVLWQLFFISLAILLAALKYSFIAALLLFILITLL